jgi:hypothetical protein
MSRNHQQHRDDPQRRLIHNKPSNQLHQLTDDSININHIIHQSQVDTHYAPVSCVDRGTIPSSQRIVAVPEPHQIYVNRRPYYENT